MAHQAHHGQWGLHPRRSQVTWCPLGHGRACVECEARRLLGDVDVESGARKECGAHYGNQAEYAENRISLRDNADEGGKAKQAYAADRAVRSASTGRIT